MKKILLLFFVIFHTYAFACKCDRTGKVGIQFQDADFVGEIEILKIRNDGNSSRSYTADVKVLQLYKGAEIKKVQILGRIGDVRSESCEIKLEKAEKYLVYLSSDPGRNIWSMSGTGNAEIKENFMITSCTPLVSLESETKYLEEERSVLHFLKELKGNLPQAYYFNSSMESGNDVFKDYKISDAKNSFAIYKLKVNNRSEIDEIEAVQNFGSSKDEEIMKLIQENLIILKGFMEEARDEEVFLTIFYVPENVHQEFEDSLTVYLPEIRR